MSTHVVVRDRGHELAGIVREGESWRAAATRICGSLHIDPVPVDLSGEVKRFAIDHDAVVTVRPMSRGDLPALTAWRRADHVRRWWVADGEPTEESVVEQYGPRIDGLSPTRMWVAELNARPVGFVQDYLLRDYPDYAILTAEPDAVGLDYAIGEVEHVGRGLGARVLWAWMLRARRRFPQVTTYAAAPDHRNAPSLRVLAKAGFEQGLWFDEPLPGDRVATVVGCRLDVARVLA